MWRRPDGHLFGQRLQQRRPGRRRRREAPARDSGATSVICSGSARRAASRPLSCLTPLASGCFGRRRAGRLFQPSRGPRPAAHCSRPALTPTPTLQRPAAAAAPGERQRCAPTAEAPTIRLADYRPPAFLVETVELTFAPRTRRATRVRARIAFRRNPARAGEARADLRLDGRGLDLVSAAIDGTAGAAERARPRRRGPDRRRRPRPRRLHLGGRDRDRPRGQHRARGPLHVARHVLHPVRGPGLPQDHLLARPPRRDGAASASASRATRAGPALQRQPRRLRPRLGRVGGPLPQALLPLRAGRRRPRRRRGPLHHPLRPRRPPADLGPRRRRAALRLRHGRAEALDAAGTRRPTAASTTSTAS